MDIVDKAFCVFLCSASVLIFAAVCILKLVL